MSSSTVRSAEEILRDLVQAIEAKDKVLADFNQRFLLPTEFKEKQRVALHNLDVIIKEFKQSPYHVQV